MLTLRFFGVGAAERCAEWLDSGDAVGFGLEHFCDIERLAALSAQNEATCLRGPAAAMRKGFRSAFSWLS